MKLLQARDNLKSNKNLIILLVICIVFSGIIIGAPIEQTHRPIIIMTMVLCCVYMLLSKHKVKLIRNKVDIFIMLLGLSTIIPLVFGKSISITSEVNYIFRYISSILIYICVREHLINYPESKKIIINSIVAVAIIQIIIGIDSTTTNIFAELLSRFGIIIEEVEENRLGAVFCYANALAIVIAISIILNNLNYIEEQNKVKKGLYGMITTFLVIGLSLTYSRLVLLFLVIYLIIYILLISKTPKSIIKVNGLEAKDVVISKQKNRLKVYDMVKLLVISLVVALIYNPIYFNIVNSIIKILIWIVTAFTCIVSFGIVYFSIGIEKKLENVKIEKILIIMFAIFVIMIIVILLITGSLNVFKDNRKEYEIQVGSIKPNEEYTLNFEFENVNIDENAENFKIDVIEMDEYFDEIYDTKIEEKDFLENKEIKIKTTETTNKFKIVFTKINDECEIVIKKLTINGKNKILDYKLIPDMLEHRIENTIIAQKGLTERKVFIEDGLKLIKENWLFGKGGNAWEYDLYNYCQYFYIASQVHSYILQVGIEYGILGMISLIGIIICVICQYIKSKGKFTIEQVTILVALGLLITHSFIDFEMTYVYVQMLFFILLAMEFAFAEKLQDEEKAKEELEKYKKINLGKYLNLIYAIIITVLLVVFVGFKDIYDSTVKTNNIDKLSMVESEEEYKKVMPQLMKEYEEYFNLERHYNATINYYFEYAKLVQLSATTENEEETVKKLNYVYDAVQNMHPNYYIEMLMYKYTECKLIADRIKLSNTENEELKQLEEKFYKLVADECINLKTKIEKDYRLYRISKKEMEYCANLLENMYIEIQIDVM